MSVAPAVAAEPGVSRPQSPYVGLVPYDEDDAEFFFGRSIESGIVAANLRASRLTILYGPSGVGKSSLLMAGAVHDLHEEARAEAVDCPYAVCVLRSWRDDPVPGLTEAARDALQELCGPEPLAPEAGTLADTLREWTNRTGTLFVVLDQFEEYFQYHPDEADGETLTGFAAELARIVNDPALPVNVLLSIREDAWAKLDHFEGHIPALFSNYVRVDHLDLASAREAIEGPIGAWNASLPAGEQPFSIEPACAEAVLHSTAGGRLTLTAGAETPAAQAPDDRIEAPFLQLVLNRLWFETVADGAHILTYARLVALGGAKQIVENHLLNALGLLSPAEKDTASDCFRFLVSSGRTKIAHTAPDLAEWTQRDEPQVKEVLDKLCAAESGRILRAVAPAQDDGSTSYELFHDILAEPIIAWRKEYEQRRQEQAWTRRRRRIVFFTVAFGLIPLLAALTILAYVQRGNAKSAERSAASFALGSAANSLLPSRPDVSLLFSLAAFRASHSPTVQVTSSMISALEVARQSGAEAILHGHADAIRSVVFSPDGTMLATASNDATVRLWDVHSHSEIGLPLAGYPGEVDSVAFSPDGRTLATAGFGKSVLLWDVRTHKRVGNPLQHSAYDHISGLQFSPDGHTLATGGSDSTVRLWDAATGALLESKQTTTLGISGLAFSPDGRTIATADDDGTVGLLDATTLDERGQPLPPRSIPSSVAFSPDGHALATAGSDGTVRLWDVRNHKQLGEPLRGHRGSVLSVAFSPDGRMLATAGVDRAVRLWDAHTHAELGAPLLGHTRSVSSVAFSPDGRTLATASDDKTVRLWDVASVLNPGKPLRGHTGAVFSVAFSPDGKILATASADKSVRLWDVHTHTQIGAPLVGHQGPVWVVAFSPDGQTLATGSDDHTIRLWNVQTHAQIGAPLRGHTSAVWSVAFSPDGRRLATASADATLRLWDVRTHTELGKPLRRKTGQIWNVAFSPDGSTLATAGADGSVGLLDGHTLAKAADPLPGTTVVWSVAFSPDGKTLATAGADRTVRLWDLKTHAQIGDPFRGHAGQVFSVAFSRDGKMLATAGDDHTVRLWDVRTHSQLGQPLRGHTGPVLIVAFSPDGRTLATASDDKTARLWDGILWHDRSDLEAQVCALVTNLSRAEWEAFAPGLPYRRSCSG